MFNLLYLLYYEIQKSNFSISFSWILYYFSKQIDPNTKDLNYI